MRRSLSVLACLSGFGAGLGIGLSTVRPAFSADDARLLGYGRHLAQECSACHRIDGTDNGIPSIIGWERERFLATLKFYQTGARTNPVMVSVAT